MKDSTHPDQEDGGVITPVSNGAKTTRTLEEIYAPVCEPLKRVPALILETLDTPIPKMRGMVGHFFSKSGKLLRPALILLGAGLSRSLRPGPGIPSERNETAELYLAAVTEIEPVAVDIPGTRPRSAQVRMKKKQVSR